MSLKPPSKYGYVVSNNICLFQNGPLSQTWGAHAKQQSTFVPKTVSEPFSGDNEQEFNCCEKWMMATKAAIMDDGDTLKKILKVKSPKKHKELGRQIKNFDPERWDKHKRKAVYCGNYWKFSQNQGLKEFLLSFPLGTIFAYANLNDTIWGIGLDINDPRALDISKWNGENLLGDTLRSVYSDLKSGASPDYLK